MDVNDRFLRDLILQLNCISRFAAMENAPNTQKMINQVINFIRYKNGREGQVVSIKEEINAVNNFFEIYKIRFSDIFEYQIHIESQSCLEAYVPHYTIMAFAENIMYYAFENKEDFWKVKIFLKKMEDFLEISIYNNSVGYEIKSSSKSTEYDGIFSTIQRVHDYFEEKEAVDIKNFLDTGSIVTIKIPIH